MRQYLHEILTLLGPEKSKLPWLLLLFSASSLLDLIGIVLIGPYVAIVADPNLSLAFLERIRPWVNLETPPESLIILMSIVLLAVFLIKTISATWINYVIYKFSINQQVRLQSELMDNYQSLPYEVYLMRNSSEYIHSIQTLVTQYSNGVVLSGIKSLSDGIMALAIIILLAWISPMALTILISLSVTIILSYERFFRKNINKIGKDANNAANVMLQGAKEGIEGLKEIRVLGKERYFYNKVHRGAEEFGRCHIISSVISTAPRYLLEFVMMAFVVSLVALTITFNQEQSNLLPTLSMFGMAAIRLLPAINLLSSSLIKFRFYRDGVSRLYNDITSTTHTDRSIINKEKDPLEEFRSLSLVNITYRYPSAQHNALSKLTLDICSGESIGLIGASGCGKTTIVDIILGLLTPKHGEVLLNGQDINTCLEIWHKHVAYIPQQIFLTDDTFRNNIALGIDEKDIDHDQLNKAVEMASLSKLVQQLPKGMETMLGERGMRLSGGQRQRIALARAFYNSRDVLIMDEATSALDNNTEQEIVKEIERLKGKITLLVIAHRLSTVSKCDRIYKIEDGTVTASGTPLDILEQPN